MNPISTLLTAVGDWTGTSQLFLDPDMPAEVCDSRARLTSAAKGRFALLEYDWSQDGTPQQGTLLAGYDPAAEVASLYWVDSWHMGNLCLTCVGVATDTGVDARGRYAAPPGPDWGWRIVLAADGETLRLTMYNTPPEGEDELAVEAVYSRSA